MSIPTLFIEDTYTAVVIPDAAADIRRTISADQVLQMAGLQRIANSQVATELLEEMMSQALAWTYNE